ARPRRPPASAGRARSRACATMAPGSARGWPTGTRPRTGRARTPTPNRATVARPGTRPAPSARWRERRHGQAVPGELLPVELGLLTVARPDDGLAGAVDAVGQGHAAVERHAGDRAGQGEGDAVERVVRVVLDDHK